MGLWDAIKGIGKSFIGGIGGSLLDIGGSFFEDKMADANAKQAWERQKNLYDTRYQRTMKDMEAAGLNPILAAASGGFNVGSGPVVQQAQTPDVNLASSAQALQQANLLGEEEKTEKIRQLKVMAEVKTEIFRKYKVRNEAGRAGEEERRVWFEIEKLHSEVIKNMKTGFQQDADKERIRALTKQLQTELVELARIADVYRSEVGAYIKHLKEIREALGIQVGVGVGKAF